MTDFFSNQGPLDESLTAARSAFDANRRSGAAWDEVANTLLHALNDAETAARLPTIKFSQLATKNLGEEWMVLPAFSGKNQRVDVWAPGGAICRYDVDATDDAVIAASESLAKSRWSHSDISTGSTGQSWWDEGK